MPSYRGASQALHVLGTASGRGAWVNSWTDAGDFQTQTVHLDAGQTVGLVAAINGFSGSLQVLVNDVLTGPLWLAYVYAFGCQFTASNSGDYIFDLDAGGSVDAAGTWVITLITPVVPPDIIGAFADNKADVVVITDPAVGNHQITGDNWASFSATTEGDDPTELGATGYVGWAKLVLTNPTTVGFDTFGSGMLDTILFLYAEETITSGSISIYSNDDVFGSGHGYQSSVPNPVSAGVVLSAGTYWLAIVPYDGAVWNTDEAEAHLNVHIH